MEFKKYQHLERYGTTAVQGINEGCVYIFPKLDGSNASLWLEGDTLCAGSRNRKLSFDADNAGFYNWAIMQDSFKLFFAKFPNVVLYGEWLVPHSLKTYEDSAWRKFYVFDVYENDRYVDYDIYVDELKNFGINYIPAIGQYYNPDLDTIQKHLEENTFLVRDGFGNGEGIVIKNYQFVNRFGHTIWAKIVTSEFKERHKAEFGGPVNEKPIIEQEIVDYFVTAALIEKTYAKIEVEEGGFTGKHIPRLLATVFYDLVAEDAWNFVKKHKFPVIDFKLLNSLTVAKIKTTLPLIFGK